MKISNLRRLLNQYDQSLKIRNIFFKERIEIVEIKAFMERFKGKLDDYPLDSKELFNLVAILSKRNDINLLKSMRALCGTDDFFDMFVALNYAGIINKANYTFIADLTKQEYLSLYRLIANNVFVNQTSNILEPILILLSKPEAEKEALESCLIALAKHNILNEVTFGLLSDNVSELQLVWRLCKLLIKFKLITTHHLQLVLKMDAYFQVKPSHIMMLKGLSFRNLERLDIFTNNLTEAKMLNAHTFKKIIERISISLPKVERLQVTKQSRTETGCARSEFVSDSLPCSFFTEHDQRKQYPCGTFGKVKKVYLSDEISEPYYALKVLNKINKYFPDAEQREVKYHRFLGRSAFNFYHKKKSYVLMEWLRGAIINKYSDFDLISARIEVRLKCVIDALGQLNHFHANHRLHGDVKWENLILNLRDQTLKFIDFGSARKHGSHKLFTSTLSYLDPNKGNNYDFCDDIYSMGIVVAKLFPEIYYFDDIDDKTFSFARTNGSFLEGAVVALVSSMMKPAASQRCTSEDALLYCKALLANSADLDETLLNKLIFSFINRTNLTVEDILRGRKY